MRAYRKFAWKDSNFRICSSCFDAITHEIMQQRRLLESYIDQHPDFRSALVPIGLATDAPLIVRRMQEAAVLTGVGPMAAVAGTIAQMAVKAALRLGAEEAIVENGGDLYIASCEPIGVGLYAGRNPLASRLAFAVESAELPLAVCSSSSKMGHSYSFGDCDLATVVSKNASLADAAATLACNLVKRPGDVDAVLERVGRIQGVDGVLLVKGDRVGLIGQLPQLVKNLDPEAGCKVTRDCRSR